MNGIETFLNAYGLPAIAAVLLIKSAGVPIPIPADVLMFLAAARVTRGTDGLGQTFALLLIAISMGDFIQFWLARGPGRAAVYRLGRYLGLTPARLDAASTLVRKSGAHYVVDISDDPPVGHHRPSADLLFRSVAEAAGPNAERWRVAPDLRVPQHCRKPGEVRSPARRAWPVVNGRVRRRVKRAKVGCRSVPLKMQARQVVAFAKSIPGDVI